MAETGEANNIQAKHRDFFLALAEEAGKNLRGPAQAEWLEKLETEHDNLRAALDCCLKNEEGIDAGLRLAGALQRFWILRGYVTEGREYLVQLLGQAASFEPSAARAYALNGAGSLAYIQGELAEARSLHEQALAMQQGLCDCEGVARSHFNLGLVTMDEGDHTLAQRFFEQSLAIRRELGDAWGIAASLSNLGAIASEQGEYVSARKLIEESLAIQRNLGDQRGVATSLTGLGVITSEEGDLVLARRLLEESLALQRVLGDKRGIATSLVNLGMLAVDQCENGDAHDALTECLTLCCELKDKFTAAHALEELARLAYVQQQPERAIRLYGIVEALRERIGTPRPPNGRVKHDCVIKDLRTALGEEKFRGAITLGRIRSLEQVIAYVLIEEKA